MISDDIQMMFVLCPHFGLDPFGHPFNVVDTSARGPHACLEIFTLAVKVSGDQSWYIMVCMYMYMYMYMYLHLHPYLCLYMYMYMYMCM